jgi:hypothetical protein
MNLIERALDNGQIGAPGCAERHGPVAALEQPYPEPFLQSLHLMADGAMGDVQLLSGRAEAFVAGSRLEDTLGIEGRQVPVHASDSSIYM